VASTSEDLGMSKGNVTPEEGLLKSRIRLFLGPKPDYYFNEWDRLDSGVLSWNWYAFFFGEIWMAYRKMYFYVLTLQMLLIAVAVFVQFVLAKSVGEALVNVVGYVLYRSIIAIYLGLKGNGIYKGFVDQAINLNVDLVGMEYANRVIRTAGGVSVLGAVLMFFVLLFELALTVESL